MGFSTRFSLVGWLALLLATGVQAASPADRVVIVANAKDSESLEVARHYAAARGVPVANIIALPLPRTETVSWSEFVATLWTPLMAALVKDGWIDAIEMRARDDAGRSKYAISGHRISYLVLCRGVPLRISHDPELRDSVPIRGNNPRFKTNEASVDSELALLPQTAYPVSGFIVNPLFRRVTLPRMELMKVVKVSRLDGPTLSDALGLVDRAIEAENSGLVGRAYVDIGGAHPEGDRWLETAAKQLTALRFDTDVDREKSTLAVSARFDAPAVYLGWYAGSVNGPFLLPHFRFPAGAIALHIHSFSATTLRSASSGWTGPLVARGATATVGNVFEPYLQLTHRPDLLLQSLAGGNTWGDAVCFASPVFSWQTIAIGDPLYRPFAKGLADQWRDRNALPARLAGYVTVRRMIEAESDDRRAEVVPMARKAQKDRPSLAVALALSERMEAAGDNAGVAAALGFLPLLKDFRSDEWALAQIGAMRLAKAGETAAALAVFDRLFATPELPKAARSAWMREARQVAVEAGDVKRITAWSESVEGDEPQK